MTSIVEHLIGLGSQPHLANAIAGGVSTLTAAGTTLGTATIIPGPGANVSIVSSSGLGVKLPNCSPGSEVIVFNGAPNALFVYPFESTTSIGAGSAGAGFNITTKKTAIFKKLTATQWASNLTA